MKPASTFSKAASFVQNGIVAIHLTLCDSQATAGWKWFWSINWSVFWNLSFSLSSMLYNLFEFPHRLKSNILLQKFEFFLKNALFASW